MEELIDITRPQDYQSRGGDEVVFLGKRNYDVFPIIAVYKDKDGYSYNVNLTKKGFAASNEDRITNSDLILREDLSNQKRIDTTRPQDYQTRGGYDVISIVKDDSNKEYPLCIFYKDTSGQIISEHFTLNGKYSHLIESSLDIIPRPQPQEQTNANKGYCWKCRNDGTDLISMGGDLYCEDCISSRLKLENPKTKKRKVVQIKIFDSYLYALSDDGLIFVAPPGEEIETMRWDKLPELPQD